MLRITVDLRGWADDLDGYGSIEFALQLAMYKMVGNCDFKFQIKTRGTSHFVYDPHLVEVVATRCHSRGYEKGKPDYKCLTEYKFAFIVPSYTIANMYKEALKAIPKAEIRTYEVKVSKSK